LLEHDLPALRHRDYAIVELVRDQRPATLRKTHGSGGRRAGLPAVEYDHTTVPFISTSMTRLLVESVISVWLSGKRLANAAPFNRDVSGVFG